MSSSLLSRARLSACFVAASAWLTACGGGGSPPPASPLPLQPVLPEYSIGGTVTGSTGPVTLRNDGNSESIVVAAAGSFTFPTQVPQGANYNVGVVLPPNGQTCTVANGTGATQLAAVTNIAVTCTTNPLTLGGVVSGLGAGRSVVLGSLGQGTTSNVTVSTNGAYTFTRTFQPDTEYEVFVVTQPDGQVCTVLNGIGEFTTTSITTIGVTCIDASASSRNWTTATNITTDPDPADFNGIRNPRVGVDAAGNALAIWADDAEDSQREDLLWSRKPAGGEWTTPAAIPDWLSSAPDPAWRDIRRDPVLVVSPNGNAVAAWRAGWIGGGFDVMASFYTPATGWSTPEFVWWRHPDAPTGASNLQISQDAAGNTMVVWEAGAGYIYYNRHSPTTGWKYNGGFNTTGHFINPVSSFASDPRLAMNAAGNAVVIWRQGPFIVPVPDYDVWSSRYDVATDTWSAPQALEHTDSEVFGMSLVIDSAGVASAFWGHPEADRLHVRTARLTANTWSTPSYLETGNTLTSGYAYGAQAVIDGSDDIMVVWQQGDTQSAEYIAKRYVAGTGWLPQQAIGAVPGSASVIFSTEFTVAGNAAGHVVVAWTLSGCVLAENVPCPVNVVANEFNPVNGEWGAEEVIDKEAEFPDEIGGDASTPSVAVAPSGNAVAVWDQDNGGTNDGIRSADFR